jgi:diketogulonate reductase-like aldo/keto reductase
MAGERSGANEQVKLLADGAAMPILGLGVWQVADGRECEAAVSWALELGYRHIDTAQAYGNEASVGRALAASPVARDDVFITTKFYPRSKDPVAEIEKSLDRLGVDHVDLYVIHWPAGGPTWAWSGMESARERGYARSIGVSNFSVAELEAVCDIATQQPVVNQVQFSPFEYRRALLAACDERGVALEAYSPLGTGRHLGHATVAAIADQVERTPAQVLLRWCVQRGVIVIPKSTHRERIAENGALFDFELPDAAMNELDALDQTDGTEQARDDQWW